MCSKPNFQFIPTTGVISFETAFTQFKSVDPILLRAESTRPVKDDGKWLGAPYGEVNKVTPGSEWAPSFVQDLNQIWFGPVTQEQLYNGGTLTICNAAADTNQTEATWRMTINENGAWRPPFHAHAADEQWIVTRGKWYFQWYDPMNGLVDVDGCKISFDERGFPSGPNTSGEFCEGDLIVMPRGTFFRWGSKEAGAQIYPTWPGLSASGAINRASQITRASVTGQITPDEANVLLGEFQSNYMTFFVRPVECVMASSSSSSDSCDKPVKHPNPKEPKGKDSKGKVSKGCTTNCSIMAPSIVASTWQEIFKHYQPQSPILLKSKNSHPRKQDGKMCNPLCDYKMHSSSLVQDKKNLFINACPKQLKVGCKMVTAFYAPDLYNAMSTIRLTVNKDGAWQTPFLSFFAETRLIITQGEWKVRWYSPDGSSFGLNNQEITFNARGYPSGPNRELTLYKGDTIMFKRGTFFQWGSDVSCSTAMISQTGCITNGVLQEWSKLVEMYIMGELSKKKYYAKLEKLQRKYYTPIVYA